MPIYEYRCADCRRRTSVFVRSISNSVRPTCEHCGGRKMSRLMSRFAVQKGGIDFEDPSSFGDLNEDDPKAMARWARRMADEMGEDMGPEFDDMVGRLEAGEDPESVMGDGDESGDDAGFDDDF